MNVSAKLNNLRMPNRKVKLVADLIIGMDAQEAIDQMEATIKRSSPFMIKLLQSAIANGENNFGIDKGNMYIFDVVVKEGVTLKRWMPKAYGRATPIRKRSSQIEIVIAEKEEGKNRKTKEQVEKEKQARIDAKKKANKEVVDSKKEIEKDEIAEGSVKEAKAKGKTAVKKDADAPNAGWANKVFRRKSGM
ncbi:MAG: 50S ribosomal protein L22 [Parcubacteria group bacterium]|jgi:large subunit ribosomal protein L22